MMKPSTAYFAGGCFWGMEELLRQLPGVLTTEVGYCGGAAEHATYQQVKTGQTNHAESLKIVFDTAQLNYANLLYEFFRIHNPSTPNRQGNDSGAQYRSAIFYVDDEQKNIAAAVIKSVDASGVWQAPIVTQLLPFEAFYRAENFHQKYLLKNPAGYTCHYPRPFRFGADDK